jgi:hypothetical protein
VLSILSKEIFQWIGGQVNQDNYEYPVMEFLQVMTNLGKENKWNELKKDGSQHYKNGGIEPIDLYRSSGMLKIFVLCNIIKYAYRGAERDGELLIKDLKKIIHYSQYLLADLEG